MKILILSQHFWPENFRINELAQLLSRSNCDITVLTGKPNYPTGRIFDGYRFWGIDRQKLDMVKVIRIPLIPRGQGSSVRLFINYVSFVLFGLILSPFILKGKHFNAVFVFATSPILQVLPAIYISWLKRAPLVVWVQDLWPESLSATGHINNKFILFIVKLIVKFIYQRSKLVLVQSRAFMKPIIELGIDKEKIKYLPNFTIEKDDTEVCQIDLVNANETFEIVFAGNIGAAQSIETIIEAAKLLRGHTYIKFVIVGTGSRHDFLLEAVSNLKLENIEILGQLPTEAMPQIYAKASVLLISLKNSSVLNVTIPSKLQSYLYSGKAILGCVNGEAARIIEDADAGYCVTAEDHQALAEMILNISLLNKEVLFAKGQNGRRYYEEHFSTSRLVPKLISQIETITTDRSVCK